MHCTVQRIKGILRHVIRSIHFAHFHSHLRYRFIFWDGDPRNKSIFKIQKRVSLLISNVGGYTSCKKVFKAVNIIPVSCMYTSETVCYIRINIYKLVQNTEIHNPNTCPSSDLHIQFCRTSFFTKSVVNTGIKLYKCQVK
jgi:hypothetical protein